LIRFRYAIDYFDILRHYADLIRRHVSLILFHFLIFDCLSLQIFSPISDDITPLLRHFQPIIDFAAPLPLADISLMPAHAALSPLMPPYCFRY
jgi:hypothetical protein